MNGNLLDRAQSHRRVAQLCRDKPSLPEMKAERPAATLIREGEGKSRWECSTETGALVSRVIQGNNKVKNHFLVAITKRRVELKRRETYSILAKHGTGCVDLRCPLSRKESISALELFSKMKSAGRAEATDESGRSGVRDDREMANYVQGSCTKQFWDGEFFYPRPSADRGLGSGEPSSQAHNMLSRGSTTHQGCSSKWSEVKHPTAVVRHLPMSRKKNRVVTEWLVYAVARSATAERRVSEPPHRRSSRKCDWDSNTSSLDR
jgi:hypothetical protein